MKIVAISDVHGKWNKITIPDCDLLISAGDYSFRGERWMIEDYHRWLNNQKARHIISGQGNHELAVEADFAGSKALALEECPRCHFIDEGPIEIEGVKIWYSAITPWFYDWAWNRRRTEEENKAFGGGWIKPHWNKIPEETDVLVTHGPPYGILDVVRRPDGTPKERVGCEDLKNRILEVKPDLHIFGHIHHSHGQVHQDGVSYYNVSICDEMYMPSNPITVIDYEQE